MNRKAVFSLVMALLGVAMLVPIAGSIIGIVMGNRAMDEVDKSGERGGPTAQAAVVFGWFGLVSTGIAIAAIVFLLAAAAQSQA